MDQAALDLENSGRQPAFARCGASCLLVHNVCQLIPVGDWQGGSLPRCGLGALPMIQHGCIQEDPQSIKEQDSWAASHVVWREPGGLEQWFSKLVEAASPARLSWDVWIPERGKLGRAQGEIDGSFLPTTLLQGGRPFSGNNTKNLQLFL